MKTFKESYNEAASYKELSIWRVISNNRIAIKSDSFVAYHATLRNLRDTQYKKYKFIANGIIAESHKESFTTFILSKDSEYYDGLNVHNISYYRLPASLQSIIDNVMSNGVDEMNAIYEKRNTLSHDDEMPDVGSIFD